MICIFLSHAPQCVSWVDNKWTAWGANGVKLLFLIAGFLTAKTYINRDVRVRTFWRKRFWRLAPLYWCAILFWFILYMIDKARIVTFFMEDYDVVAILLNVFLLHGLFVHGNNTVVPGGWYVGTIALFYLLAPMIIEGIRWLWKRSPKIVRILPIVCLGMIYIINWLLYRIPFMTQINTVFEIYYSMIFQMPSLLLGINLWFELSEDGKILKLNNKKLMIIIPFLGVAAWYSAYVNYDFNYLVWGYVAALVFIFCYNSAFLVKWNKLIIQLGNMSYEFFLVHLFFTIAILPIIAELLRKYTNDCWAYIISVLVIFLGAYLSSWVIWRGKLAVINKRFISCDNKYRR